MKRLSQALAGFIYSFVVSDHSTTPEDENILDIIGYVVVFTMTLPPAYS